MSELYIGGKWMASSTERSVAVVNPTDHSELASLSIASADNVDVAVDAARTALEHGSWANCPPLERAEAMGRLAAELQSRAEDIAQLVTQEMGMPIELSRFCNGAEPVNILRYYEELARGSVTTTRQAATGYRGLTTVERKPLGVVAMIVPWNYPMILMMTKLAPAMAAGCTAIVKPSPETSLSTLLFAEAVAAADLPPGVINVVTGDGSTGEALVRHAGVDAISFTGSTPVGRRIGAIAGERLVPASLELGGKSAAIVLDDADLDQFFPRLDGLSFVNSGQTCFSMSRILAPRSRYDEVVDGLVALAQAHKLGDPRDGATTMGPVASRAQRDRVESYLESGREQGARAATGGRRSADLPEGYFIEPTVFASATNDMRIAREEIFGPVLSVIAYANEAEAVAMANDSEFGLAGTVWTQDVERGRAIATQIKTGTFGINAYQPDLGVPWGGVKASGYGREYGPEAIDRYRFVRATYEPASASAEPELEPLLL